MSEVPRVYVVILTYNHYCDTRRVLTSIRTLSYPNVQTLVIDNGSADETVSRLPAEFPEVWLHCSGSNLGFAAGANIGLRLALAAGADYILLLNNDVTVPPGLLEPLVAATSEDVGAVAPLIYSMEHPRLIWSAGFDRHPVLLEMRGGARGEVDHGQWHGPFAVDYLLGCALLLPAAVLQKTGLFDERYFFYYEDLDLSTRIREGGYKLIVVPEAGIWHKGAATAEAGSPFHVYHMARGSVIYFRSHARGLRRPLIYVYRVGSSVRKSVGFVLGHRWDLLAAHWKGIRDGWASS